MQAPATTEGLRTQFRKSTASPVVFMIKQRLRNTVKAILMILPQMYASIPYTGTPNQINPIVIMYPAAEVISEKLCLPSPFIIPTIICSTYMKIQQYDIFFSITPTP